MIFFTLNFRFACFALLSKRKKLLRNIFVTSLPETTKNQVAKMGWKADKRPKKVDTWLFLGPQYLKAQGHLTPSNMTL